MKMSPPRSTKDRKINRVKKSTNKTNKKAKTSRKEPLTYAEYKTMKADKANKTRQNDVQMNHEGSTNELKYSIFTSTSKPALYGLTA